MRLVNTDISIDQRSTTVAFCMPQFWFSPVYSGEYQPHQTRPHSQIQLNHFVESFVSRLKRDHYFATASIPRPPSSISTLTPRTTWPFETLNALTPQAKPY